MKIIQEQVLMLPLRQGEKEKLNKIIEHYLQCAEAQYINNDYDNLIEFANNLSFYLEQKMVNIWTKGDC